MKKIKTIEPNIANSELKTMRYSMDQDQFEMIIVFMRSIRRILIYMLAVMFAVLCYVIEAHGHLPGFLIFVYPAIFVLIALSELYVSRKILRKSYQDKSKPSTHE